MTNFQQEIVSLRVCFRDLESHLKSLSKEKNDLSNLLEEIR